MLDFDLSVYKKTKNNSPLERGVHQPVDGVCYLGRTVAKVKKKPFARFSDFKIPSRLRN